MIRFHSFQSRVVFFFLGLLSLVQLVVFFTVDITNTRYAKRQIEIALEAGVVGLNRLLEIRTAQLAQSAYSVVADPPGGAVPVLAPRASPDRWVGRRGGRRGPGADRRRVARAPAAWSVTLVQPSPVPQ